MRFIFSTDFEEVSGQMRIVARSFPFKSNTYQDDFPIGIKFLRKLSLDNIGGRV